MKDDFKFCLKVLRGPDKGRKFLLENETAIVGRSRQCDVTLSDEAISRQHAQVSIADKEAKTFEIKDLKSRNGVYIYDTKVTSAVVNAEEYVHIGESTFVAHLLCDDDIEEFLKTPSTLAFDKEEETEDNLIASIDVEKVKLFHFDTAKIDQENIERRLQTLYKIGEMSILPGSLSEKLEAILDIIYEVVPAESGCILVQNPVTGKLEAAAVKYGSLFRKDKSLKVSWTIIDKSIRERIGILATDALKDPRFDQAESVITGKFRSVMAVPLFFHDMLKGVIFLNTSIKNEPFSQEDLEFLTGIGNETAIVIEHNQLMNAQIAHEKRIEVGELVAGLSHYIKNVLFAFSAPQAIIDDALTRKDYESIDSVWPILKRNAGLISDLVKDMLYFSKDKKPEKKLVRLDDIIMEVVKLYKPIAKTKDIEFDLQLSEELPQVNIDPQSFHRIFLNLVKNALDATIEVKTGTITIGTCYEQESNVIEITVSDNGVGIAPQNTEKIFHYLFSTKGYEGTGIGLYVTKKIIEDHGGTITVTSEIGQGSTFTIRIPQQD